MASCSLPGTFTLTAIGGNNNVSLSWTKSADAITYTLKRGTTNGGPYGTTVFCSASPCVDSTAVNGTTYFYVMTASNSCGTTDSSQVSAMPAKPVSFVATGSMSGVRSKHSATLLGNGKVLVAGGQGDSVNLATAELYDPATGRFTFTAGNLTTTYRMNHTGTLLPNGKVLIAGGHCSSLHADIFDPDTGRFTATGGDMVIERPGHTATLLENGKVLIAGGYGVSSAELSAELYDPAADSFSATTGAMLHRRCSHSATLLEDGRTLIAGGRATTVILATAELYGSPDMFMEGAARA
jgi:hypothetical protein